MSSDEYDYEKEDKKIRDDLLTVDELDNIINKLDKIKKKFPHLDQHSYDKDAIIMTSHTIKSDHIGRNIRIAIEYLEKARRVLGG